MYLRHQKSSFLLATGHGCIDLCQGAIPALLPTLLIQRHLSYTEAAGLIFAANIVSSVIQPLFGHAADRLRAPWLMPAGLLIAGSGLALASLFSPYWLIVLCIGISGVGIAAFHPEAARQVNELTRKQKATSMSLFALGGNIGFALGPVVMTALLFYFGLRGTIALLLPLTAMALLLIFTDQHRSAKKKEEKEHQEKRSNHWGAFTRLTGAIICRSIIFYGLNTFLTLYWIKILHQPQVAGAAALSFLLFAGLVGTLLGGWLADRYGRHRVVLLASGALFPLLLLFVFVSPMHPFLAWVLLIPIGVCLFMPFSVMIVMGQSYLPDHVGTASGVTLGLAFTAGGITAPLLGRVADLYGLAPVLMGLAGVPLVAVGCILTLPRDERSSFPLSRARLIPMKEDLKKKQ